MYVPAYAELSEAAAATLAAEHPFAVLCSESQGAPFATHLPLLLESESGTHWLRGHVARPNPHWRSWDGERGALAIFRGPHAYVSPRWYQHAGEVPTWNYLAAHASGRPHAIHDPEWLRALLQRLAVRFDPEWGALTHPPETAARHQQLLGGIVGIEMRVEEWIGKAKLGQNKVPENRESAARHLTETGDAGAAAVARQMRALPGH